MQTTLCFKKKPTIVKVSSACSWDDSFIFIEKGMLIMKKWEVEFTSGGDAGKIKVMAMDKASAEVRAKNKLVADNDRTVNITKVTEVHK